ncbi:MAG TPA: CHAP domain-containing protein [Paracoccaceae bacterium]|nr:CHAP domain-containing protein [Paracoccaceae bacterium]
MAPAEPAGAKTSRQEAAQAQERVAEAVAEAQSKRARGQRVWCVPFARTASGIEIKGNARTWWAAAEGRYARGRTPQKGAVMVFAGMKGMPMGHVGVVAEVLSDREIRIDHANWSRNRVTLGHLVRDVSENGDWTRVQLEHAPGSFGRTNPVHGFIYPGEMVASR